jgi:GT2 family glycosyltransferase
MSNLTVSIVNYNAGDYLLGTLESLRLVENEAEMEIVVVDNASTDDSIAKAKLKYPKIKYILNKENLGFGKAHNQVLKTANTEFILVLNPDMIIKPGVIKECIEFFKKNDQVGAITPRIIFEDGRVDMTAHRGFPTPWASLLYFLGNDSLYHQTMQDMKKPHEVDVITGAFFFTTKEVLEKVGVFDEDYFMYAEDIDLCYRIKKAGLKVMYLPDIQVVHFKGISSGLKEHTQQQTAADLETKKRSLNYFYSTMKIFYKKHLEKKYPFFVNRLVYLGIDLRWWLAKRKLTV